MPPEHGMVSIALPALPGVLGGKGVQHVVVTAESLEVTPLHPCKGAFNLMVDGKIDKLRVLAMLYMGAGEFEGSLIYAVNALLDDYEFQQGAGICNVVTSINVGSSPVRTVYLPYHVVSVQDFLVSTWEVTEGHSTAAFEFCRDWLHQRADDKRHRWFTSTSLSGRWYHPPGTMHAVCQSGPHAGTAMPLYTLMHQLFTGELLEYTP